MARKIRKAAARFIAIPAGLDALSQSASLLRQLGDRTPRLDGLA